MEFSNKHSAEASSSSPAPLVDTSNCLPGAFTSISNSNSMIRCPTNSMGKDGIKGVSFGHFLIQEYFCSVKCLIDAHYVSPPQCFLKVDLQFFFFFFEKEVDLQICSTAC